MCLYYTPDNMKCKLLITRFPIITAVNFYLFFCKWNIVLSSQCSNSIRHKKYTNKRRKNLAFIIDAEDKQSLIYADILIDYNNKIRKSVIEDNMLQFRMGSLSAKMERFFKSIRIIGEPALLTFTESKKSFDDSSGVYRTGRTELYRQYHRFSGLSADRIPSIHQRLLKTFWRW